MNNHGMVPYKFSSLCGLEVQVGIHYSSFEIKEDHHCKTNL